MSTANQYPSWWPNSSSYCAKAAWLTATGRAKTFEDACSMLAKRGKRGPQAQKRISTEEYQRNLERRGLS
jgi:hypothetical protein